MKLISPRQFILVVSSLLIGVGALAATAHAAPLYTSGQTLDPNCLPTDPNCTIVVPALSGANADITSLSALIAATSTNFFSSNLMAGALTATDIIATSTIATSTFGGPVQFNGATNISGTLSATVIPLQDTAANLFNVIPASGQIVYETDTKFFKGGDGSSTVGQLYALNPFQASSSNFLAKLAGGLQVGSLTAVTASSTGHSFAFGFTTGSTAAITASGVGSLSFGSAAGGSSGGTITSSGNGSFAGGNAIPGPSSGTILSSGAGSFAFGKASGGTAITASGDGSFAFGFSSANGQNTTATGNGSVAMGQAVNATANNSFAFGSSFTNSTSSTFLIGFSSTPTLSVSVNGIQLNKDGAGTLQTDAAGNITVSSDERLKNFKGYFTKGLSAIMGLTPVNYTWKDFTGLDTVNTYTGFFAQNVEQYIPEAVGSSSNGYLTLQDRPLIATLVNAVQQLAGMVKVVVADSVTAVVGVFTNLTVGSRAQPSGITLYDKITGQPYCVVISNGQLTPTPGVCPEIVPQGAMGTTPSTTPSDTL
jgi:hypothetical protein